MFERLLLLEIVKSQYIVRCACNVSASDQILYENDDIPYQMTPVRHSSNSTDRTATVGELEDSFDTAEPFVQAEFLNRTVSPARVYEVTVR